MAQYQVLNLSIPYGEGDSIFSFATSSTSYVAKGSFCPDILQQKREAFAESIVKFNEGVKNGYHMQLVYHPTLDFPAVLRDSEKYGVVTWKEVPDWHKPYFKIPLEA